MKTSTEDGNNGRIKWTDNQSNKFIELCIKGTEKGYRSGNGWGVRGWDWLNAEMKREGMNFTTKQMKNRWDWMKLVWKLWRDLKGPNTSGLGWDYNKGTVDMPDELWRSKIEENPKYAKFREKGISPELENKYLILFHNLSTGDDSWAPSSGILPTEMSNVYRPQLPEFHVGKETSEQRIEINDEDDFEDSLEKLMSMGSFADTASTKKCNDDVEFQGSKYNQENREIEKKRTSTKRKKGLSGAEVLAESMQDWKRSMKESMDARKLSFESTFGDKPGCSIHEVMNDLRNLPDLARGSDIFLFASSLLEKRGKREMYVEQITPEDKLKWIHYQMKLFEGGMISLKGDNYDS